MVADAVAVTDEKWILGNLLGKLQNARSRKTEVRSYPENLFYLPDVEFLSKDICSTHLPRLG